MFFGGQDFFGLENVSLGQALFMEDEERQDAIRRACLEIDAIYAESPHAKAEDFIDGVLENQGLDPLSISLEERSLIDSHIERR